MSFARQSLGSLATLVFGLAVSVLLPRILGPEARGEYQLAVKLAGLEPAVAQWGLPEGPLLLNAGSRARPRALIGASSWLGRVGSVRVAALLGLRGPPYRRYP